MFGQNLIYLFICFSQAQSHTQYLYSVVPADYIQHDSSLAADLLHCQIGTIILFCSSNDIVSTCLSARVNHPYDSANVESECSRCYM